MTQMAVATNGQRSSKIYNYKQLYLTRNGAKIAEGSNNDQAQTNQRKKALSHSRRLWGGGKGGAHREPTLSAAPGVHLTQASLPKSQGASPGGQLIEDWKQDFRQLDEPHCDE